MLFVYYDAKHHTEVSMSEPFTPEQLAQLRQAIQEAIERAFVTLARKIDPLGGLAEPYNYGDLITRTATDPAALDTIADQVLARLRAEISQRR